MRGAFFLPTCDQAHTDFGYVPDNVYKNWSTELRLLDFSIGRSLIQRWWFRSLLTFILCIGAIAAIRRWVSRRNERLRQAYQIRQKITELEKRALLAQMNPHFLFNTINAIQGFMSNRDFEGAMHFLNKFSRILRRVFQLSSKETIPISQEIDLIEDYLALLQLRFPERIQYQIIRGQSIIENQLRVPAFLVQPHIDEMINGSMHSDGKINLLLKLSPTSDGACLELKMNPIDKMVAYHRRAPESEGLSIVRERIRHFNENPSNITVHVSDHAAFGNLSRKICITHLTS